MAFDFTKLSTGNSVDTILHPREIFAALPNKNPKYQYPRDVQTEVWNQWFERRTLTDTVVRMNTGSGKTTVALLMLKSCLNEEKGPALYLAPDQYLARQIMREAEELGLEVTDEPHAARFLRGKAILVTTIRTLINGQSVFGVGHTIKVPIGSLVIDDAHACLETTEAQFTVVLDEEAAARLIALFKDDLRLQSEATAQEVENGTGMQMLVPFWAWSNKQKDVVGILRQITQTPDSFSAKTTEAMRFNYPLIRDVLRYCRCVLGNGVAEISPRILPVDAIPAFTNAQRRIVMSATLADDSILCSHFDFNASAIAGPIMPLTANDIGDRMILIPQEINPKLSDEDLKAFFTQLATKHNVVVIVPSKYRSKFWQDKAAQTLTADNLDKGVQALKDGHIGLTVLINKYDGIDLPKRACDVLIIDGLPDVRRGIDKLEEGVLMGTEQILTKRIQRIEQGLGRGVRSNDDNCVCFLMGKTLTNFLYRAGATQRFGTATRAQLKLSTEVSDMLEDQPIEALAQISHQFLARDPEWVKRSKGALAGLKYEPAKVVNPITLHQREAFARARRNDVPGAVQQMNAVVNEAKDPKIRGWLKQQMAEYQQLTNAPEAQLILRSAISDNPRVIRPLDGIEYQRLKPSVRSQAEVCSQNLKAEYDNGNSLIIGVGACIDQLRFEPDTPDAFEQAVHDFGAILGFTPQRPEDEFGRGPDVLWAGPDRIYFVIECKNGVTSANPINKHDCNQLNGSIVWCRKEYGADAVIVPVMIHPHHIHEHAASLHKDSVIITAETLPMLKDAARQFANIAAKCFQGPTKDVAAALTAASLTTDGIRKFFVTPQQAR